MKTVEDIEKLRETSKRLEEQGIPKMTLDEINKWINLEEQKMPEGAIPTKPKCPKCGKDVDALNGCASASVPLSAYMDDEGTLHIEIVDGLKLRDLIDEFDSPDGWFCPSCDSMLFGSNPYEHGNMERFLKGLQMR